MGIFLTYRSIVFDRTPLVETSVIIIPKATRRKRVSKSGYGKETYLLHLFAYLLLVLFFVKHEELFLRVGVVVFGSDVVTIGDISISAIGNRHFKDNMTILIQRFLCGKAIPVS